MRSWVQARGAPARRQYGLGPRAQDKAAHKVAGFSVACFALDLGQAIVGDLPDARGINIPGAIDAQHQHELAVGPIPAGQPVFGASISCQIDTIGAVAATDGLFTVKAPSLRRIVNQRYVLIVERNRPPPSIE